MALRFEMCEGWRDVSIDMRGQPVHGVVWSRLVLWNAVRQQPVLFAVVADPDACQSGDPLFTIASSWLLMQSKLNRS